MAVAISTAEAREECALLEPYFDYCPLCQQRYDPYQRELHVVSSGHQLLYFRRPGMRSMHERRWCDVCSCGVTSQFSRHISGRKHQNSLSRATPPPPPAYTAPATYAAAAQRPPPSPAPRPAPRPAARSRPQPAAAAPSKGTSEVDAIVDDNLCQLCQVRVGPRRECSAALIARHQRGRQHRTQRQVAQSQWTGEATIAAWKSKADAHGLKLLPHVNKKPFDGGQLVMEVGESCELDLRVRNDTNKEVSLIGVFVVPPLSLPGLSWRQCRQAVLRRNATHLLPATIQPTSAQLGNHRSLLVLCVAGGHSLALPLDVSVVPANSRAEVELLKPTSAYRPKPTQLPSAASAHIRAIEGERPPSKLSAKQLYTRKLDAYFPPNWLNSAYEKSKGRDPPEVTRALAVALASSNHSARFSLLLWLEEWQMAADIQTYDTQGSFSKNPAHRNLFGLTVPGLSEARPSVLVGDRILVSEASFEQPSRQQAGAVFAGIVWRVEQDWVYLKFHDDFQRHWLSLKKFHIRFSFDRVSIRRTHQAVKTPHASTIQRFFAPSTGSSAAALSSAPPLPSSSSSSSAAGKYAFLSDWKITVTSDSEECYDWVTWYVLEPGLDAVGFDLEFGMRGGYECIDCVQIAADGACLVYSPRRGSEPDEVPGSLYDMLTRRSPRKLVIGEQDKQMLLSCWGVTASGVEDLQQQLMQTLRLPLKPGLERMVHGFLPHLSYSKDKALQRSTFAWPLSQAQVEYAASDAVLTLLLAETLDELTPPETKRLWDIRSKAEALGNLPSANGSHVKPTQLAHVSDRDSSLPDVPLFFNRGLNAPQQEAVRGVCAGLHHPYPYIIFGPPGTGKTTVLVECLQQLLRRNRNGDRPIRILATAPSNSAADLLAERMAAAPVSMRPDAMFRMNAVSRDSRSIPALLQPFSNIVDGQCTLRPRAELLKFELVVCTCITAATLYSLGCEVGDFSHILVDEAGHATEPEALAAMTGLIDAEHTRIVLGGDPLQLGPIIRSPLASKHGLGMSMLERLLIDSATQPRSPYYRPPTGGALHPHRYITKLLFNYRSHPAILEQPNAMFYKGELIASADRLARESLQRWPEFPVSGFPILLHHVVGREEREGDSPSWWNSDEAMAVVEYVRKLLSYKAGALTMADIGIITPYRKQVQKIRQLLGFRFPDHAALKVGSVEEYQGQERRVILISTVRSQQLSFEQFDVRYRLGFVNHPKRLNVALTRAKAALVVVGNASLLSTDPNWAQYIEFLYLRGAVRGPYQPQSQGSGLKAVAAEMAGEGVAAPELQQLFRQMGLHTAEEKEQTGGEEQFEEEDEAQVPASEELPWKRDD